MEAALQQIARRNSPWLRRWSLATAFVVAIALYLLAHRALHFWLGIDATRAAFLATMLNDLAWWTASLTAALTCRHAAIQLGDRERTAWLCISFGCFSWLVGHTVWSYYELILGGLPTFPHWMQGLFLGYSILIVAGLLLLPKPVGSAQFTTRHGGNLVLIVCAILVMLVIALGEPSMLPARKLSSTFMSALHTAGLTTMFVTALYLLWSYRWRADYWPLLLIVAGAGIHTATYIAYLHQMMTSSYLANSWFNVSWMFVFGGLACAGRERIWQQRSANDFSNHSLPRERWLEAVIPALLIAAMLAVAWTYADWLTPRIATVATAVGVVFALVLGLRELWIQGHEQRLLSALNASNESILAANSELRHSESRYKTLSAELEQRVADRTRELQQAYREMEVFSYAVAHDLKAPLRAVDGFGSLLAEEYDAHLDDKGRGYVQRMRRNVLKMAELIDDLLAYARIERREFHAESVVLPTLIERALAEQRDEIERTGAQVRLELPSLAVRADADGLLLACRNLLQNALKFSRTSQPPKITVSASATAEGVQIAIADNGIGFDMTHHERIFEMFQRLHRAADIPGTGVGLSIVRKAVERMGGRVWAVSAPGAGASFFLLLPANDSG